MRYADSCNLAVSMLYFKKKKNEKFDKGRNTDDLS